MNIHDVEAFWAVADTRNFSKAADSLYVTQSTVSYRIKSLENELGFDLLKRNRGEKNVELTSKGKAFILIAQQWITLWRQTMQLRDKETIYNLRIAQVDWFVLYPFAQLFSELSNNLPMLKLDIQTGHSAYISDLVSDSLLDIGFAVHPHFNNQLICKPLFRDPLIMVCSKDLNIPLNKIRPQDLNPEKEIFWRYSGELRFWHDQWWDPIDVPDLKIDFSIPLSFNLLSKPGSWLVSPRSIAETMIERNPSLEIHEFTAPPPDIICYYIFRNLPNQETAAPIKLFIDFLENHKAIMQYKPYMAI